MEDFAIDLLAQRCQEETEKYRRQRENDPRYCFELMRRALADRAQVALTYVMQIYDKQVLRWVYLHPAFAGTGETADFFASQAFFAFYRQASGEKFARFPSLPAALQYLKRCVWTSVQSEARKTPHPEEDIEDMERLPSEEQYEKRLHRDDILKRIHAMLPDRHDQLLVNRIYIHGCKPADVVAEFPSVWPESRKVTVALQRIHRILRKDRDLRDLLGLPPEPEV